MANEKIFIDLEFTNNIQKAVSDIQRSLSKLDANLDIKADTKQAEKDIKNLQDQVSKSKDANIQLEADNKDALKKVQELENRLKSIEDPVIKPEVDDSGLKKLGSSIGGVGKVLGGLALGGAVAGLGAVVTKGAEAENALQKLGATTGATGEELEALRKRSFDAFRAGVGEDIASATQALAKADKQLGDFLNPDEVDKFVQKSQAIADLYDKDVSEVIEKSRSFIQNFGLDGQEAGDLIALAMRDGQNQLDDVLDTLEEYPSLLSQTGASAEEFVGILTRGVQAGARDTDRLADAIKEAQIRILAGDFTNAFAGLTEGANESEKAVIDTVNSILLEAQAGDIDIIDAIGLSANKVKEALAAGDIDRALADQLNVAVSGTLAEEQGAELYGKIFGAPIDEEAIKEKAKQAGQAVEESFQFQGFEGLQRELEATITEIANSILPVVQPIINTLTETIIPLVGDVFENLKPLITSLLSIIEPLIKNLGEILTPIIKTLSKALEPVFDDLVDLAKELLPIMIDLLKPILALFTPLLDLLAPIIRIFIGLQKTALYPLIGLLQLLLPPFTKFIELLVEKLEPILTSVGEKLNSVGTAVGKFFGIFSDDEPVQKVQEIEKSTKELGETTNKTTKEFEDYTKQVDASKEATEKSAEANKKQALSLDDIIKKLAEMKIAGNNTNAMWSDMFNSVQEMKKEGDLLAKTIDSIKQQLNDPILKESEFNETITNINDELIRSKGSFDEYSKEQRDATGEIVKGTIGGLELVEKEYEDFADVGKTQLEQVQEDWGLFDQIFDTLAASYNSNTKAYKEMWEKMSEEAKFGYTTLASVSQGITEIFASGTQDIEKQIAQLALDQLNSALAFYTPFIVGTAISQLGPVAGPIAAFSLIGILAGLINTAKGAIGAEDGVIGIDNNYKGKVGKTDTIPLMVAKGESVMTTEETAKNKALFEAIRKDPNNGAEEWFKSQIAPNLLGLGVELSPQVSYSKVNDNSGIIAELKALRSENASLKDALKGARKIEYFPSERDVIIKNEFKLPKNKSYLS